MKHFGWLCLCGALLWPAWAAPGALDPELRVAAKIESLGRARGNNQTTQSRALAITIENRGRTAVEGLEVQWKIVARDIRTRKLSLAAGGRRTLGVAAAAREEFRSDAAHFTRREGAIKTVGKGQNRRRVAEPDSGTDYAGYVVEVFKGGKLVAESSTVGMRERAAGMRVK